MQSDAEAIVVLMGATGTGKSTLIHHLTKDKHVIIGHDLESTSDVVTSQYVDRETRLRVTLVDTPGFDDSREDVSDTDILGNIANFLQADGGRMLNGIVYLHRISDPRFSGTAKKNLKVFKELCGDDNLDRVRFVTTHWDVVREKEAKDREVALRSRYFKPFLDAGAQLVRHDHGFDSAKQIILDLVRETPMKMKIQKELDAGMVLGDTSAGAVIVEEMQERQKKHKQDMEELKKELEEANENDYDFRAELDEERHKLEERIAQAEGDQNRLATTRMTTRLKPEKAQGNVKARPQKCKGHVDDKKADTTGSVSMSAPQRKPYNGVEKKLVIGFDIGTTFSSVSYVILVPQELPIIQDVTQFPGQQKDSGGCEIPSVVYYDGSGNVVAAGAEANEGLVTAKLFKLHLWPSHLIVEQGFDVRTIPSLPPKKTAIEIFGDFLTYLYQSTEKYIRERQGDSIWESIGANAEFVLSHPNGWEGKQQSEMHRAAIIAGLVKNETEALQRISFVTEGEASLHFCMNKISGEHKIPERAGITVVDCAGGTINISTYVRSSNGQFREIVPSECLLQGSFFVTQRAEAFLTDKFRESRFAEYIDVMTRYFDKTTKTDFNRTSKPYFIRFGPQSENDPQFDIRLGSVQISGKQIAEFFRPAVRSIIHAIEEQSRQSAIPIEAILMVGGLATSDHLFSKIDSHFKKKNMRILRPDGPLNKAVAEGAVSFKIDHFVTSRVARYTHGIEFCPHYDPSNPEHIKRWRTRFKRLDSALMVPSGFSPILIKGAEVLEEKESRWLYSEVFTKTQFYDMTTRSFPIKCYRNRKGDVSAWTDIEPDFFSDVCVVTADISGVKKSIQSQTNHESDGEYYRLDFDVIFRFGLPEFKAQIGWIEDGKEERGSTSIVYT